MRAPHTPTYLHEVFELQDGNLFFRMRPLKHFKTVGAWKGWNTKFSGKKAGCVNNNGYVVVAINHKLFYAHQIVATMYGIVGALIDHKDRNRLNNAPDNLRGATSSQNAVNSKARTRVDKLPRGVHRKKNGRYVAYLYKNCRTINLGTFDTLVEASQIRVNAARKQHGDFEVQYGGL